MIYAYCLSLFSMHFFGSHSIANFKLRLINQQTGDCTDSAILNAAKLTPGTFPVPIKLKGGQRLLVKVKLLSLPYNSTEILIGEGVVTFDKNSIDNTLRVPIYDKQRGVEEVAICSIDFFLSGFEVDKHISINPDKSRSRFDDLRDRTEDAVYSQMSYTLESERDSAVSRKNSNPPKPNPSNIAKEPTKIAYYPLKQQKPKQMKVEQQKPSKKIQQIVKQIKRLSPQLQHHPQVIDDQGEEDEEDVAPERKGLDNIFVKPFTLQNNVYLEQSPQKRIQANKRTLKQTRKKPPSNLRKKFALQSEEEKPYSGKKSHLSILSPENLRKTVKDNQEMLLQLKKYISNIEKEESPKHKRRRNMIKVEEFSAYKSQDNFVKYHVELKPHPTKVIKNLRAIRIIENQIKQPSEQKVITQLINQVVLTSLAGAKMVTFDATGFRSYCLSSGQSETIATIMVPTFQKAVKVRVSLGEEGDFEGVIGFQEGESMNISLVRLNGVSEESILQRSEFKLLFDIKATDSRPSARVITNYNYHNNQISFREPYELIAPDQDIKTRVGQLSFQPWGFIKSYAEGVVLSAESKEVMDKIDQQLPRLKEQLPRPKPFSQPKSIKQPSSTKRHQSAKNKQQDMKPRSVSRDYLESPIRKVKPIPSHVRRETDSINSIRNGNRNNYRFQERTSSKQIKQAWEQILFKKNVEDERRIQAQKQKRYPLKVSSPNHSRSKNIDNQSNTDSDESLSTFKPNKMNKLYKFVEREQKKPIFPVRTFTLRISNVSITQPQAIVDLTNENVGKFVKFAIKDRSIYFTEVIFSGNYNSILWKLEGCIFEELTGVEKLKIQIYQTLNNRITTLGISYIRVNRLYFLRGRHIYNGTIIAYESTLSGEFTLGFEIEESCPFQIIHEEDEDTINIPSAQGKQLKTLSHQSQKNIKKFMNKPIIKAKKIDVQNDSEYSMLNKNQLDESVSMPIGLSRE